MSSNIRDYGSYLYDVAKREQTKGTEPLPFVVGSVVAGALAAAWTKSLIAGVAVSGVGIIATVRWVNRRFEIFDDILQTGCVAPYLKKDELNQFLSTFGQDETLRQLQYANQRGLPIYGPSTEFVDRTNPKLWSVWDRQGWSGDDFPNFALQVPERLIKWEANGYQGKPEPPPTPTYAQTVLSSAGMVAELPVIDLAKKMGQTLKPTIISAMPRTGKGVLLANGWREAKIHRPDLQVWVIDLKAHPKESGYWEGADQVLSICLDLVPDGSNDPMVIEALEDFISRWRASDGPRLLIFDEQLLTKAKLPKWYKTYIPAFVQAEGSAGESYDRVTWLVLQSPQLQDVGLTGGSRSIYHFVAIAKNEESEGMRSEAWLRAARRSEFIPSLPDQKSFELSPRGTIFYSSLTNCWGAMPEYPVPSPIPGWKPQTLEPKATDQPTVIQPETQVEPTVLQPETQVQPTVLQPETQVQPTVLQPETPVEADRLPENPYRLLVLEIAAEVRRQAEKQGPGIQRHAQELKTVLFSLVGSEREDLLTIIKISAEHGEITARDVTSHCSKVWLDDLRKVQSESLEDKPVSRAEKIRALFTELEDLGIGQTYGEGKRKSYLFYPQDTRTKRMKKGEFVEPDHTED